MKALDALLEVAERPRGATDLEISAVERALGVRLPDDHKALLRESDGVEGFIAPAAYLMLWATRQIHRLNEAFAVGELVPGVVLIGTDGGNTGYGFQWKGATARYLAITLVGMEVVMTGASLTELLERIIMDNPANSEPG